MPKFSIYVSYSQVAVFDASLENPFNNWTDDHVSQGFAWRAGSSSFRTLSEADQIDIDVTVTKTDIPLLSSAVRVIEVPFTVPPSGLIQIASIEDGVELELKPGDYHLRFEACANNFIRLVFKEGESERFEILRADSELSPKTPLLKTADPA